MARPRGRFLAGCLVALFASGEAAAGSLTGLFRSPSLARLGLAPLGPALARTVASTYPVASASASVTYVYDPVLDTMERRAGIGGPFYGERTETVGQGRLALGLGYAYVQLTSINGQDLDDLVNRTEVGGKMLVLPVPGGVTLKDGRFSSFLPVRVDLDLGVQAHIVTPSVTYGITPDLDVNLALPIVDSSLDITVHTLTPDPRLPAFMRQDGVETAATQALSGQSAGVGDLVLRSKYVLHRGAPMDVAAGLGLSVPSGDADDLHGRGTTLVQPLLIASRTFGDRVELFANAGLDLDAGDVGRSAARWAVGGIARVIESLEADLVFLGLDEFGPQSDPIATPFFFQIERNDIVDASVGLRWHWSENGSLALNALVPLNDQGLRAAVVPAAQLEYVFSTSR